MDRGDDNVEVVYNKSALNSYYHMGVIFVLCAVFRLLNFSNEACFLIGSEMVCNLQQKQAEEILYIVNMKHDILLIPSVHHIIVFTYLWST